MGILLTYDVTDEQSFQNIRNWMKNIEEHAAENVNKILIGNKCDLLEKKVVDTTRGQQLAESYNIKFLETSAKNNQNVEEAFFSIARDIKARLIDSNDPINQNGAVNPLGGGNTGANNGNVSLGTNNNNTKKNKEGCCK
jgi:Ras-related protein Rab-8A